MAHLILPGRSSPAYGGYSSRDEPSRKAVPGRTPCLNIDNSPRRSCNAANCSPGNDKAVSALLEQRQIDALAHVHIAAVTGVQTIAGVINRKHLPGVTRIGQALF